MRNIKKKNENSLINQFIKIFKNEIQKIRGDKKRFSFVLTGGSSPKKLYKILSKAKVDWSKIDIFWADERFVSSHSKDSNFGLAYNLLIKKIKIHKKNLYKIKTEKIDIRDSALLYKKFLKKYFKNKKISFDIVLLGMGSDGHIASIFPGSKELKEKFIVKPIYRSDFKRISLGINTINNSKKIFLWLNNKEKSLLFKKYKKLGKNIPVNNLNKKKMYCFSII